MTLWQYFAYPTVRYALIVGVLISLCASLLGVTLVLKRFSFIGDGLSHVAFGATAIAAVLGLGSSNMFFVLPVTILCAVFLLRPGQNAKIHGDAAIAMLSVGALAVGYLLLHLFSASANVAGDVVWLSIALSAAVVLVFLLFYNQIFAITFDERFARAVGTKTEIYNLGLAVLIAVIIVLAMKLVGALLISALVVFPALAAMRLFKSFKAVTISAGAISVLCAVAGIIISILAETPVGATIVAVDLLAFLVCSVAGRAKA